jgi:hypothetical protein
MRQRKKLGAVPLRPLEQRATPLQAAFDAYVRVAEADGDGDYFLTLARFRRAVHAFVRADGWRPPEGAQVLLLLRPRRSRTSLLSRAVQGAAPCLGGTGA